ncbi:MAG: tyrosine-type recombinase/integrase [Bacteroidales bacterium]|nr:tyrosine-type recombinase/integrase [Bacteroidales bacterium]MDD3665402.1 tyrosine-type recombinase/integrase [Bacteroidales bacterium]
MKTKRILFGKSKVSDFRKVYIELYESREARSLFDTGVKILSEDWDNRRGEVKKRNPLAGALNNLIISKEMELLNAINSLLLKNETPTILKVRDLLTENTVLDPVFTTWCTEKLQTGNDLRATTLTQIKSVLNAINDYEPGLLIKDINLAWVEKYHRHLLRSGLQPGSTRNHHKQIRKFYRLALLHGVVSAPSPYNFFKLPNDRGKRIALTPEELQQIQDIQPRTQRLTHVKDVFLFACYTGLSFADLKGLEPKHIIHTDNQFYIMKKREKLESNEPETIIPLIAPAREILQRYEGGKLCLPVYANANYNEYLKEIAVLANIEKNLTSHVARHTFATIGLNSGIPIETVSKLLGHNSIKTTQIYAKVLRQKLTTDILKLENIVYSNKETK